jgi:hypothetical protein
VARDGFGTGITAAAFAAGKRLGQFRNALPHWGRLRAASSFGGSGVGRNMQMRSIGTWRNRAKRRSIPTPVAVQPLNVGIVEEAHMTNREYRDPSDDYPPTRPSLRTLAVAAAVVAAAVAILNWSQVSAFAHISQIEAEIEHAVGL